MYYVHIYMRDLLPHTAFGYAFWLQFFFFFFKSLFDSILSIFLAFQSQSHSIKKNDNRLQGGSERLRKGKKRCWEGGTF